MVQRNKSARSGPEPTCVRTHAGCRGGRDLLGDGNGGSWGPAATCARQQHGGAEDLGHPDSERPVIRPCCTHRRHTRDPPLNRGRRNGCPSGRLPHEIRAAGLVSKG